MPLGITIGLTPHAHIACFIKRLTQVIVDVNARRCQSTRWKPNVLFAFQSSRAWSRSPTEWRVSLNAMVGPAEVLVEFEAGNYLVESSSPT